MNRRGFLKLTTALTVTTSLSALNISFDKESVNEKIKNMLLKNNFKLVNKHFVLDEPLVLENISNLFLKQCSFKASSNFKGDSLIYIKNSSIDTVDNCIFDAGSYERTCVNIENCTQPRYL